MRIQNIIVARIKSYLFDRIAGKECISKVCDLLVWSDKKMYETEEGCLSIDDVRKTTRYQEIEVEYYDFNWKKQRQKLSGWTAQICQHEIDHLSGKII